MISSALKSTIGRITSKLNETEQKKEYYNISTYGDIEALNRLASDTAGLLTLYYKEPIESIDTTKKIKGGNAFNEKISWIRDVLIGSRPEDNAELGVVIVAEYITAWVMEEMKRWKRNANEHDPLPQKLWFSVAQRNCVVQSDKSTLTDILGTTIGRKKIPIKKSSGDNSDQSHTHVQLRHLIGCVSIVTDNGNIFQYNNTDESLKKEIDDLKILGYVYVTPFLYGDQSVHSIIDGRNLIEAPRDIDGRILSRWKDIESHVRTFQDQAYQSKQSVIITETTRQVAELLHDQHTFVDPKEMKRIFDESQEAMDTIFKAFKETIDERIASFQTTLIATKEQLQQDLLQAKKSLTQANDEQYQIISQKIDQQLRQVEKNVEKQMMQRLNTIENQLKVECDEMRKMVTTAGINADEALRITTRAVNASEESARQAEQARVDVMKLAESTERQQQEFQSITTECRTKVEETIVEQKDWCKQAILAVQTQVEDDFERVKVSAEQTATNAQQSANAATEATEQMRVMERKTREQLDLERRKIDRIQAEMRELRRQNRRLVEEADEAKKQARRAADTATDVQKRFDDFQRK